MKTKIKEKKDKVVDGFLIFLFIFNYWFIAAITYQLYLASLKQYP